MSELPLAAINVSGPDAFEFLQNQLTNDLERLDNTDAILSAWCNPKGRVIWFGKVYKIESGYTLSVPADIAEELVRRLTLYRFRSQVEFTVVHEGLSVDAAALIEQGHPFIGAQQSEEFTAHMLNLDLLDAISIDKGCYTGQEIIARTHYRGATKRRMHRFESGEPVTAGDKVHDGARAVGDVVNASGTDLLAVVPIDKIDAELTVSGIPLTNVELPYL